MSRSYDRQLWLERVPLRHLLRLVNVGHAERLLDVATGTGLVLREFAAGPIVPREVVGVDASAAMLARVPPLPANWSLRLADARELPFAERSFDVVIASYLLHVLSRRDRELALSEAWRVLRPRGRLGVLTPVIPPQRVLRPLAVALDRLAIRDPTRFGGLRALDPRPALVETGFQLVAARYSLLGYFSICVAARRPG